MLIISEYDEQIPEAFLGEARDLVISDYSNWLEDKLESNNRKL
jgi:hypothetical protein